MYRWLVSNYTVSDQVKTSMFAKPSAQVSYHEAPNAFHFGNIPVWIFTVSPITRQPRINALFVDGHASLWYVARSDVPEVRFDANWYGYPHPVGEVGYSTFFDMAKGWDLER